MKKATAKRTFQRTDTKEVVRAGDRIIAPEAYINELERVGMVRNVIALPSAPETKQAPTRAVGAKSSVSPAAQALLEQTSSASVSGTRRRRKTESL